MKLPAELNPRVEVVYLPRGTAAYDITVTFNEEDHVYRVTELSEFSALNVLMRAAEDGYGQEWTPVVPPPPAPGPDPMLDVEIPEEPEEPSVPEEPEEPSEEPTP